MMTTHSVRFQRWFERYEQSGDLEPVRLGATQEQVRGWFGDPDNYSFKRFQCRPLVWRYGIVEFHFTKSDALHLIYYEEPDLTGRVILSV